MYNISPQEAHKMPQKAPQTIPGSQGRKSIHEKIFNMKKLGFTNLNIKSADGINVKVM